MTAPQGHRELQVDEVIQRGDVWVDRGVRFSIDNKGHVLGVRCIGVPVRKTGGWFRPTPQPQENCTRVQTDT